MKLVFFAPDATEEERDRGLMSALLFLKRAGISVEEARQGVEARAAWQASGNEPREEPDPVKLATAEAWDNAVEAAMMACYRGRVVPWGAALRTELDADGDA